MDFTSQDSSFATHPQTQYIPQQQNTHLRPPTTRKVRATKIAPKQEYDTIAYTAKSRPANQSPAAIIRASPNAKYLQAVDGDLSQLKSEDLRRMQNRLAQRAHQERKRQKLEDEESDASFESTSSPEVLKIQRSLPKFETVSPSLSDSKLYNPVFRSPLPKDPTQQLGTHIASLEALNSQQQQTILKQQQILQHLRAQVNGQYAFSHPIQLEPFVPHAQQIPQIQLPPIDAYQALPDQWQSAHTTAKHDDRSLPQLPEEPEWMTEEMKRFLAESPPKSL